jgi:hypothetical protein
MKPRMTRVEPEAVFEWPGHLGLPGVFHGRRRVELAARGLDRHTLLGFVAMNEALKARVEAFARAGGHRR